MKASQCGFLILAKRLLDHRADPRGVAGSGHLRLYIGFYIDGIFRARMTFIASTIQARVRAATGTAPVLSPGHA